MATAQGRAHQEGTGSQGLHHEPKGHAKDASMYTCNFDDGYNNIKQLRNKAAMDQNV